MLLFVGCWMLYALLSCAALCIVLPGGEAVRSGPKKAVILLGLREPDGERTAVCVPPHVPHVLPATVAVLLYCWRPAKVPPRLVMVGGCADAAVRGASPARGGVVSADGWESVLLTGAATNGADMCTASELAATATAAGTPVGAGSRNEGAVRAVSSPP